MNLSLPNILWCLVQDGDDVLEGGPGADFFDCGIGFDTVVDFNPNQGDITNNNCEDVRTQL